MTAGTKGTKEIRTEWPIEDGLTAGTTTQKGHVSTLEPEEGSIVPQRLKAGL